MTTAPAASTPAADGPERSRPIRTLVLWCPDWPVRAWGVDPDEPAAVLEAGRVTACSVAARQAGVSPGLRRRDAQARCPDLRLLVRDPNREARAFEPTVAAVARFSPLVEVERPGLCAVATRGPSRYFGGDEALARIVLDAVGGREPQARVGVADGSFAALWAARLGARSDLGGDGPSGLPAAGVAGEERSRAVLVEPGATPRFLASLPVTCLLGGDRPAAAGRGPRARGGRPGEGAGSGGGGGAGEVLVEVLWQLGLRTLGDFAALPEADVLARFGDEAARRHRQARGLEDRPLDARPPPPDLTAVLEIDPPVERVDQAAFAAKALADRLHDDLSARGLACTRVLVEAETCHGETLRRLWRHEGVLAAAALADRTRWQLEGWLAGSAADRPTGGLSRLALVPDEVVPARGRQLGFWGGEARAAERAARAAARVAAMSVPEAVTVPERRGGRRPDDQFELVPVAALDLTERGPLRASEAPWPGRLPVAPALVHGDRPFPVEVLDAGAAPVTVTGRGIVSAPPVRLDGVEVLAWAGPWPLLERWWDPVAARRQARFQVVTSDGRAHLLVVEGGRWWSAGRYD
jgi:protein ImuB